MYSGGLGSLTYRVVTMPTAGGWNWTGFEVLSNPSHSVILWFSLLIAVLFLFVLLCFAFALLLLLLLYLILKPIVPKERYII